MIGKYFLFLYFISFLTYGENKVILSADRSNIAPGDLFSVQVIIEGDTNADLVKIENIESFNIEGESTSSSFKMINGNTSREKTITYELSLKEAEGKEVFLGPAVINIDGQEIKSNYLTLAIGASAIKNNPNQDENYYFLNVNVEDDKLYVNQKTLITLKFYNSVDFAEANLITPESPDYWLEQNGKQQNSREIINGKAYKVTTIKYFFTPLKAGIIDLKGFSIKGLAILPENNQRRGGIKRRNFGFDSFFEDSFFGQRGKRRRVNVEAKKITLQVNALPTGNNSVKFDGVVGEFSIREIETPETINVNDSLMYSFVVSGSGNLDLLEFNSEGDQFKIYKDKDEKLVLPGGDLQEGRKLSYLLVPKKSGEVDIPIFKAKYFDPHSKLYKELRVGGNKILVQGKMAKIMETTEPNVMNKLTNKVVDNDLNENAAAYSLFDILNDSWFSKLTKNILKNDKIILILAFMLSLFLLIISVANFDLLRASILQWSIFSNGELRALNKLFSILLKKNITIQDVDMALSLSLADSYSPFRDENLKKLRASGSKETEIKNIQAIYQKLEREKFSAKYDGQKVSKNDLRIFQKTLIEYLKRKDS